MTIEEADLKATFDFLYKECQVWKWQTLVKFSHQAEWKFCENVFFDWMEGGEKAAKAGPGIAEGTAITQHSRAGGKIGGVRT